jgi:hypothetical protein
MKKFTTFGILVVLLAIFVMAAPVLAKTPTGETITIAWLEDAVRYSPDGSIRSSWTDDPLGPAMLVRTGKAYHFADIGEFYNQLLPDVRGSMVISGAGVLSGHATYTSLYSGLPIKERFRGRVTIDAGAGTMVGTYTQWAYAFGSKDAVLAYYPQAAPAGKGDRWFIGYTDYTAHQ